MLNFEAMFTNPTKGIEIKGKVNGKVKAKVKAKPKAVVKVAAKAAAKPKPKVVKPTPKVVAKFATTVLAGKTSVSPTKFGAGALASMKAPAVKTAIKIRPPTPLKGGFASKLASTAKKIKVIASKPGNTKAKVKLKGILQARPKASLNLLARVKRMKFKPQLPIRTLGLKVKPPKLNVKASTTLKAIAKPLSHKTRVKAATRIMSKAVKSAAAKGAIMSTKSAGEVKAKAHAVVRPVAKACKCQTAPVISQLELEMARCGYPIGAASKLLAGLHDMNVMLEKAAIQRLATHEHKTLSAQQNFEKEVLSKLSSVASQLPRCHPVRTRAHLAILKRA